MAFSNKCLNAKDLNFWSQFSNCHDNWTLAWELHSKCEKTLPQHSKDQQSYKPWLLLIRQKILQIEKTYAQNLPSKELLNKKITQVYKWIASNDRSNFVNWTLSFLYNENCHQTKKRYLFIQGPPNSGKTFFMKAIVPPAHFSVKNRTFAHFGSDAAGLYELHLFLFDDPEEIKGCKAHQLESSILLNLATYNLQEKSQYDALPVKHGFMYLKRGQLAIISNRQAANLFDASIIEAMRTRLCPMTFSHKDPFPLRCVSTENQPFKF